MSLKRGPGAVDASLPDPREAKAAKAPTGASTPKLSTRSIIMDDQDAALDDEEPVSEPDSEASYDRQLTLKLPGAHVKLIHDDADASTFGEDVGQDAGDDGKAGTRSDHSAVPAEAPVVEAPAAETGTSERSQRRKYVRPWTKWQLALALSEKCLDPRGVVFEDLNNLPPNPLDCENILDALAKVAAEQLKAVGRFDVPDVCRIQKKSKPSVSGGKRVIAGREVTIKARTATTILKAYPCRGLSHWVL